MQITKVVTYSRSKATSMASTAILMSAAFFLVAPILCGISMSSTWLRVMACLASANIDQSAYALREITRPRSARALEMGSRSNSMPPRASLAPIARFSKSTNSAMRSSSMPENVVGCVVEHLHGSRRQMMPQRPIFRNIGISLGQTDLRRNPISCHSSMPSPAIQAFPRRYSKKTSHG